MWRRANGERHQLRIAVAQPFSTRGSAPGVRICERANGVVPIWKLTKYLANRNGWLRSWPLGRSDLPLDDAFHLAEQVNDKLRNNPSLPYEEALKEVESANSRNPAGPEPPPRLRKRVGRAVRLLLAP